MPDIEALVKETMKNLSAGAAIGRVYWEALAQAIEESEDSDEIQAFLGEIVEGEI